MSIAINAPAYVKHAKLIAWVQEIADLVKPAQVVWADGSQASMRLIIDSLIVRPRKPICIRQAASACSCRRNVQYRCPCWSKPSIPRNSAALRPMNISRELERLAMVEIQMSARRGKAP